MINLKEYQAIFSMISDLAFQYNIETREATVLYKNDNINCIPPHIPDIISFIDASEYILPSYKSVCESMFCELASGAPRSMQEIQAGSREHVKWYRITVSRILPYESNLAFAFMVDITAEKMWHYMSERDSLTGVYNRITIQGKIHTILTEEGNSRTCHAFIMIDIDHFKEINDNCGHAHGDYILSKFAGLLTEHIRSTDLVARAGGDEFIIFLKNVFSKEIAIRKSAEICGAIKQLKIKGESTLSASLGIAMAPEDGITFEQLYRNADKALYQAKHKGRNRYSLYS